MPIHLCGVHELRWTLVRINFNGVGLKLLGDYSIGCRLVMRGVCTVSLICFLAELDLISLWMVRLRDVNTCYHYKEDND